VKTFGQKVERNNIKLKGSYPIKKTVNHPIFSGLSDISVFEAHRYGVSEVRIPLLELARSENGVEIIKHEKFDIYGFQFHPEELVDKNQGDEIFLNTINLIKSSFVRK